MDSKKLLEEVRRTGLTQVEVARELGILQASVSKLERGQTKELRAGAFAKLLALHARVCATEAASADVVVSSVVVV